MKYCPYCKKKIQKWGRTAAGTTRFFCPACERSATARKRKDVRERHLRYELDLWLGGKDSLTEIAARYHRTRQTLWKHLRPMLGIAFEPQIPQEPRMRTLILDATYIHGHSLCALVAIDEHDRIFWRFARYESFEVWRGFLSEFPRPEAVVMDGQKGLFAAARTLWPHIPVQRCQFHVISFTLQYLGRRPKDEAGKMMLDILYGLKHVKTHADRDAWIAKYRAWEEKCSILLSARDETGRFKYPRLRSVRFIIRKALPNLFTCLDHPGVPNTTNLVEGWVNSAIAEALRMHRGLHEHEKRTLASIVLSHLKRKEHKTEVLAARLEASIEEVVKSMMALIRRPQRSVTISVRRDPDTYYRTREGLWVYDGFRNLVAGKAKPVEAGTTFKVNEDELGEAMTDAQIEAGLPKNHLFDESAVGAIVAELIESGSLDKNCWYLLYASSCVVGVLWSAVLRGWHVITWDRSNRRWGAGYRVLSPAK